MNINPYASYDPAFLKPRLLKDVVPAVPASEVPNLPSPLQDVLTDDQIRAQTAGRKADISPENLYAEVKVNGEVVATVWKSGLMATPNKYSDIALQGSKYETPQERVEFLVSAFGGEVSYYNQSQNTPSYSFSASLAKVLASSGN